MAKILGIVTAFALAIAVFVANKNKAMYTKEIEDTRTERTRLKASEDRRDKLEADLKSTEAKRAGVEDENTKLAQDEENQKKTNLDLQAKITAKTAQVAENKAKLDDIREKTAKIGDINALASKMKALKAEIEELQQNIAASEAKLANLVQENTRTETASQALRTKFDTISKNQSLPGLKTRIRSIYPSWGFVTLAAGNAQGVVTGSTLDVVRDGGTVAKLLVTACERSSATASVIPDSAGQDVALMVGDRVVPSEKPAAANLPEAKN